MSNYAYAEEGYLAAVAAMYGSIEQTVEERAIARGFVTRNGTVNIPKLSKASGVSRATLWYLLRGKKRFRAFNLVTLAKLCWVLGAQPGDLMRYVPGGTGQGLGYSSEAFAQLQGARGSKYGLDQDSEYAGEGDGTVTVSVSE